MSPAITIVTPRSQQQPLQPRERLVARRHVVGLRVERMPEDRHRDLAARARRAPLRATPIARVDPLDDAGVERHQREALGLELEERRALKTGRHAVLARRRAASAIRPSMRVARGAGHPQVRLRARPHGRARGVGLQERRQERLPARRTSRDCRESRTPASSRP